MNLVSFNGPRANRTENLDVTTTAAIDPTCKIIDFSSSYVEIQLKDETFITGKNNLYRPIGANWHQKGLLNLL